MLLEKKVCENGIIKFHAFVIAKKSNSFLSTLPPELIKSMLQREVYQLENSMIINQKMGQRLLDDFCEKILKKLVSSNLYYPTYLLTSGVTLYTAEKLIHLQNDFVLEEGMCFCERLNSLEFYHVQQRFILAQYHILKTGQKVALTAIMKLFSHREEVFFYLDYYEDKIKYVIEFVDNDVTCYFIIDSKLNLLLFMT